MIIAESIVKVYPGNVNALNGISLKIEAGEVCGYLGANGAGKSTTIKILSGMMKADSGTVSVNGIDVFSYPNKVKRKIGYVPESGALFLSLTPWDFLEFTCKIFEIPKPVYTRRIYEFMELFELKNDVKTPLAAFSKGMRQKVLLIASIIHNPDVIFWDEPLSGIDYSTTELVKNLIKDLSASGKTFFYSTHLLDIVEKVCNHVIILDKGKIVYDKISNPGKNDAALEEVFRTYIDSAAVKEKSTFISNDLLS
jgi:ABC-2 type transport system ATP-binding protein